MITATYVISFESIGVNMGDPSDDANESGSRGWATPQKSSDASGGSQRGHSTRRAGKPSTWGRATPGGVAVVTTLNVKAWESLPMSAEHETLEILSWGRRVR